MATLVLLGVVGVSSFAVALAVARLALAGLIGAIARV
jgi:hypothetical protein